MRGSLCMSMALVVGLSSCNNIKSTVDKQQDIAKAALVPDFQNKGHELVFNMVQKVGDYNKLLQKHDVTYTNSYQTPDGKTDVSNEKYIFSGELSYGKLERHERTLPELEGTIEQGYDGSEYWFKHKGKIVNDDKVIKRVKFSRPTNFYWFAMMQKLLDPGISYEYVGEKLINGNNYDLVKIAFETNDNKPKDTYQLYINKKTNIVDQFLFTVAEYGRTEPMLMKLEYVTIDGILIPASRKYKASDWEATETSEPWIMVNWTDIKFSNNLTVSDFQK